MDCNQVQNIFIYAITNEDMDVGNWLFLPIVAVIAFGLVVGSFYAADKDQRDFIQKIALILIPIVTGGVAAKFASDSWQVTKEKLAIKRNILTDFEQSYKKLSLLCDNFVDQIAEAYLKYEQNSSNSLPEFEYYTNTSQEIIAYLDFPTTNIQEMPPIKLKKAIEEFELNTCNASLIQNRFFSSMRLYHEEYKTAINKIKKDLETPIQDSHHLILRFLQSKNDSEFLDYHKKFKDANDKIIGLLGDYENELVKLRFAKVDI